VLGTFSRNAETEWRVSRSIQAFHPPGLEHLHQAFEGTRDLGKWYACGLYGAGLVQAIDGLHRLLVDFQHDLSATADILVWGELEDREISLLINPPLSVVDAVARNAECNSASGGDDIQSVISFLQGHLAMLEYARDSALGIIYCIRND
jgi:hypothetical protein